MELLRPCACGPGTFGVGLAAWEDELLVGVEIIADDPHPPPRACLFRRTQGVWRHVQALRWPGYEGYLGAPALFGESVALSREWAAIGGPDTDNGDGPTCLFARTPAGMFELAACIEPPAVRRDRESFGDFGGSVAVGDRALAIAAFGEGYDEITPYRGEIAIYDPAHPEREPSVLRGDTANANLGTALAMSGDMLLSIAAGEQRAVLYRRTAAGTWRPVHDIACGGNAVALDGMRAAVFSTDGNEVVVLELVGERLTELARIPCGEESSHLALCGDRLAVHLCDSNDEPGSIGLFRIRAGTLVREGTVEHAVDRGWYTPRERARLLAKAAKSETLVTPQLGGLVLGPDYVAVASYVEDDDTQCAVGIESWP